MACEHVFDSGCILIYSIFIAKYTYQNPVCPSLIRSRPKPIVRAIANTAYATFSPIYLSSRLRSQIIHAKLFSHNNRNSNTLKQTITATTIPTITTITMSDKTDAQIEKETGISRAQHENRNELNELPTKKLKPIDKEETLYEDGAGRVWRRNPDLNASYHQPMPLAIAAIRSIFSSVFFGIGKVPNLKFMSPNADGTYSEVCANRYTGELIIDQEIMGTYNFATDAPDAMKTGNLPGTGEHKTMDIDTHEQYGGNYKQYAKGIPIGSLDKPPVILSV